MTQTRPDPFASPGGIDTYTSPDEYFVDPDLSADADKRQYPSIAAALSASSSATTTIRLAEGKVHSWDGTNLPSGANDVVIIYATSADGRGAETTLSLGTGTYSTDGTLVVARCKVSSGASVSMGVSDLSFIHCTGEIFYAAVDAPTDSSVDHLVRGCDAAFGMTVPAAAAENGTLRVVGSVLTFGGSSRDFVDRSAGADADWEVDINHSQVVALSSWDTFIDDSGGGTGSVNVTLRDTLFTVRGDGSGSLVLARGGGGFTWMACRILVDPINKSGDEFSFGGSSEHVAYGLEIEYAGMSAPLLPVDAPNGTTAKSPLLSPIGDTQLIFHRDALQWRGPNYTAYLAGQTGGVSGVGVPVVLDTVVEGDNLVRVDPSSNGSLYRLKGHVIVEHQGSGGVWKVDAVLSASGSPSSATLLSGANPIALYTSDPAEFDVELVAASGSEEGFQVRVTKNSSSLDFNVSAVIQALPGVE